MQAFFAEVQAYIKAHGDEAMKPYVGPLGAALGHLQQATMWLMQNALAKPDNAGAGATDYLQLFGLCRARLHVVPHGGGGAGEACRWRSRAHEGEARHRHASSWSACCRKRRRILRASRPARRARWSCRRRRFEPSRQRITSSPAVTTTRITTVVPVTVAT